MSAFDDLINGTSSSGSAGGNIYVGPGTKRGRGQLISQDQTMSTADKVAEFYNWTDKEYNAFVNRLKSQNYISKTGKTDPGTIRDLWTEVVQEAAKWYSASGGTKKVTVDNILDMYAKSAPVGAENLPSRQIYQYRDEDIKALINETYQAKYGRDATPEELATRVQPTKAALTTGTLSETKKVKNPKTGKMENVTTQTPGASKTEVQSKLGTELEKLNPDETDRMARINFSDWISKNVQGA